MAQIGLLSNFDHHTQSWEVYKQRLTQWFIVNDVKAADDTKRRAILLSALSEATYKLAADLALPKEIQSVPFDDILKILDAHFTSKRSGFGERYQFYDASQREEESFKDWGARLRGLTAHCGFSNVEEALRDRFLMGMRHGAEREKLFAEDPSQLTLAKAVELAESIRSARLGANAAAGRALPHTEQVFKIGSVPSVSGKVKCAVCGFKNHTTEQCRFRNYTCRKCNKKGHLNRMCKKINFVENESVGESGDDGKINNIRTFHGEPMTELVDVQGVKIKFQVDSGSAVTAISEQMYLKYFKNVPLSKTNKRLQTYTGDNIVCIGTVSLFFSYMGKSNTLNVYVIRGGVTPLIGRDFIALYKLGITPINYCEKAEGILHQLQLQYPSVFSDELGTFTKYKIKLHLKQHVKPIFFKARSMAFALREKVDKELDRLVAEGILKPVEYSEYASPIVPVLKRDGSIRLCADYSVSINKQLLIEQYPLPSAHQLFTKLHGGQQFSKLDLSQAYAQCVLDEESQKLTCINTHRGLFQYTRLVFGLASAPAIFQRVMECVLSGMEGVLCMLDDVLVTGSNRSEHLQRLQAVLQRLQDAGLTLQKNKCDFFKDEVEYLGYTINKHGLKKSPSKVEAIRNAPTPKNVSSLQSFLGLINYYRNFVSGASTVLSPLYNLLQKGTKWTWNAEHENAFNNIKKHLSSDQVLAHFNPNATIILTVDASPSGLGAILSLIEADGVERPVSFASRTLNAAEKRYSQMQKEATAIIFGVRRFHQYLYGRSVPFVLRTDHKPLISIFGPYRGIPEVSANRLQRYAMFLSAYNYKIEYIRSANNSADYLSRASLPAPATDTCVGSGTVGTSWGHETCDTAEFVDDRASYVNFVVDHSLPITLTELRDEINKDLTLKTVVRYILRGWPKKVTDVKMRPYFLSRNELSYENGCIMRGHKILIPETLRPRILSELHKSHLGIVKCKAEARSRVWFPGIDSKIESLINSCVICSQLRPSPARAPLAVWPHPPQPFYRIHIDFLGPFNNRTYLVIVDAYTKWVEVYNMSSTTSEAVIIKLTEFMSRFGLIHTLVSDNATCFLSSDFSHFCTVNGISHVTSPAYHPASNGQAESYVKVVKKGIKSCLMSCNSVKAADLNLLKYLFDYRNSIHSTTGSSPAQLVFGRKLRSRFDLLNPIAPPPSPDKLTNFVKHQQCLQTNAYGGRNKQCFKLGDKVMYKRHLANKKSIWNKGVVMQRFGKTTYLIKDLSTRQVLKKHKNQLIAFKGKIDDNWNSDIVTDISIPLRSAELENGTPPQASSHTGEKPQEVIPETSEGSGSQSVAAAALVPHDVQSAVETEDTEQEEFFEATELSSSDPLPEPSQESYPTRDRARPLRDIPRVNYKPLY